MRPKGALYFLRGVCKMHFVRPCVGAVKPIKAYNGVKVYIYVRNIKEFIIKGHRFCRCVRAPVSVSVSVSLCTSRGKKCIFLEEYACSPKQLPIEIVSDACNRARTVTKRTVTKKSYIFRHVTYLIELGPGVAFFGFSSRF